MPMRIRIREYRVNQLLNKYVNASHLIIKIPFFVGILMIYIIVGYFGAIRFVEKLPLKNYIVFPMLIYNCTIFVGLLLLPAAIENKLSKHVIKQMSSNPSFAGNKIIRREMKSLQEFGIRLGILKRIKYSHIAAFLFSISNYTLSLLVAFPE